MNQHFRFDDHLLRYLFLTSVAILMNCTGSMGQVNLQQGLVVCYPFSGDANDGSGNGNHGSVNGATLTEDRFGNANSAYRFDGINDYIIIPENSLKNNNYTYSFWAKPSSIPPSPNSYALLSIGGPGADQGVTLSNNYIGGSIGWAMVSYNRNGGAISSNSVGSLPVVGTWYHIVQSRSNSTVNFYVNGVLIGVRSTNGQLAGYSVHSPGATIGCRSSLIQFFHGSIDDVRIYNRALSETEVTALYMNNFSCQPQVNVPVAKGASRCGSGSLNLTASGGSGYRWYSTASGGILLGTGAAFATPNLNATTTYYVSAVENGVESDRVPVVATILPVPAEPVVSAVARCGPGSITMQAKGSGQYRWYSSASSNMPVSTQPEYTTNVTATTTFYVASFNGDCESSRKPVTAVIHSLPLLQCEFPDEAKTKRDTSFAVRVENGVPPYSYQWDFGDNSIFAEEDSQKIYAYPRSGMYTVTVKITDANGCEARCSQEVKIYSPVKNPPNVFTPNGDIGNETFTIGYTGEEAFEMAIYNRWGKLVTVIRDGIRGWDGAGCIAGIYFYHIKVANQQFKGWVHLLR